MENVMTKVYDSIADEILCGVTQNEKIKNLECYKELYKILNTYNNSVEEKYAIMLEFSESIKRILDTAKNYPRESRTIPEEILTDHKRESCDEEMLETISLNSWNRYTKQDWYVAWKTQVDTISSIVEEHNKSPLAIALFQYTTKYLVDVTSF